MMALPRFDVHVMLACRSVQAEAPHGPGAMASLPYTLEGVSYTFRIEPHQEKPFVFEQFWLYLRIARKNLVAGQRELGLRVFSLDSNNKRTAVPYSEHSGDDVIPRSEVDVPHPIGIIDFPDHSPFVSVPVRLRNLELPDVGRYELRLYVRRSNTHWRGDWVFKANHFFAVER